MHRCHVVALLPDLGRALVMRTQAGWLFPHLEGSSAHAFLRRVQTMMSGLQATADVVHLAPWSYDDAPRLHEWYCLAIVKPPTHLEQLEAVPLSTLLSASPLLAMQQRVLQTALHRMNAPTAPFDSAARVRAALTWAEDQIERTLNARLLDVARHRCMRHEYVIRCETTGGTAYLKGGPDRVRDEATLTGLVRTLCPARFPETLALDREQQLWLYRALPGHSLAGPLVNEQNIRLAISALASLQKRALQSDDSSDSLPDSVRNHLRDRVMNMSDLLRRVHGIIADAWRSAGPSTDAQSLWRLWQSSIRSMTRRCEDIDALGIPSTLVLSDFSPRNILSMADGIGFIDLEYSHWSNPVLPLWRLLTESERCFPANHGFRRRCFATFAEEWSDVVPIQRMNRLLSDLDFLGQLFDLLVASHDLDLRAQSLGAELPDGFRAGHLTSRLQQVLRSTEAARA